MVDEGLVRYVRERLGEGYQEAEIRAALAQHGHSEEAINAAFNHIHREGKHNVLLPALLILLIAIAVALFFTLRTPALKDNSTIQHEAPPTGGHDRSATTSSVALRLAQRLKEESANQTPDETYYATVHEAKSVHSVSDAILICSINKEGSYKNYCFQEIAESWREPRLCEVIGDISQRDECYLGLIFNGEDQYCAKLQLEDNKKICDLLLGTA